MSWLSALTGVDVELLRGLAALCSLGTAIFTGLWTIVGLLNRRLRKAAAVDAAQTRALVEALVEALGVAKPAEVQRIAAEAATKAATEACTTVVTEQLAPVHRFFAAVELVEHRRQHRPETDVIAILESELAA